MAWERPGAFSRDNLTRSSGKNCFGLQYLHVLWRLVAYTLNIGSFRSVSTALVGEGNVESNYGSVHSLREPIAIEVGGLGGQESPLPELSGCVHRAGADSDSEAFGSKVRRYNQCEFAKGHHCERGGTAGAWRGLGQHLDQHGSRDSSSNKFRCAGWAVSVQ